MMLAENLCIHCGYRPDSQRQGFAKEGLTGFFTVGEGDLLTQAWENFCMTIRLQ